MTITRSDSFNSSWAGGSSHASSHSWSTTESDQVYVLMLAIGSPDATACVVSSITDTEGNTWHHIDSDNRTDFATDVSGSPRACTLEAWYTVAASSPNSGTTFTFNFNQAIDSAVLVMVRLSGCDTTQPIDLNVSLPAHADHANGSTTTPTISGLTVDTANTCIFEMQAGFGNSGSQSVGVHLISGQFSDFSDAPAVFSGTNAIRASLGAHVFSTQQTSFTCDGGSAANNWLMIVTAVTADVQTSEVDLAAAFVDEDGFSVALLLPFSSAFADDGGFSATLTTIEPAYLTAAFSDDHGFSARPTPSYIPVKHVQVITIMT